jgi:CheY-like chemotaxis protein
MKKTILLVDDENTVLVAGKLIVESLGYEALLARSGEVALEIFASNDMSKISLIFLDLMMPGVNGFKILKFARDFKIGIPIILQTGIIANDDLKMARDLGAADLISKPYSKKDIGKLINKYIAKEF